MMQLIDRYFLKKPGLRRFVTQLLEGDRDCLIDLFGGSMVVHSVKEHGYLRSSRIANSSALLRDELPVMFNLAALFAAGDTFCDIGANIGVYSITYQRFSRLLSDFRIYAFEANPDTFERLEKNLANQSAKCVNAAISDHDGVLDFVAGAVSHVFTTLDNSSVYSFAENPVSVPCYRLDGFDIAGDSLVLKIDVEGQEMEVLNGASGLFEAGRVKAVYVDGYKDVSVETFLSRHGFRLHDGVSLAGEMNGSRRTLAIRIGH